MIYFKKLRWRNFLSTGNQFIEVDLRKAPSTLIIGMNGAGKSTMLDALCFALFNRAFRAIVLFVKLLFLDQHHTNHLCTYEQDTDERS